MSFPASIGTDFALYAPGKANVTVRSLNPDTGAVLATSASVPAIKRTRERRPVTLGSGNLPADQCRFYLQASAVGFTPKEKDEVTDADGLVWRVDERGVELIGYGQVYLLRVSLKR